MLVLTRKTDQSILIGDPNGGTEPIEVVVVEIRGDQVRLGIVAPRSVTVDRSEVAASKRAEGAKPLDQHKPPAVPTNH